MVRPNALISGPPYGASVSDLMVRLDTADDSDPITFRPHSETELEIEEVHEKVGARQSDSLHDLAVHHAAGENHEISEPDWLAAQLGRRLQETLPPQQRRVANARSTVHRQRRHHPYLVFCNPEGLNAVDQILQGVSVG